MQKLIITAALIASTMTVASANAEDWRGPNPEDWRSINDSSDDTCSTDAVSRIRRCSEATYRKYLKPSSAWHGPYFTRIEVRHVYERHPRIDYEWAKWDVECGTWWRIRRIPGLRYFKDGTTERMPPQDWFRPTTVVNREMAFFVCDHRKAVR